LALAIHAKTGGPSGPAWAVSSGSAGNYDKFADNIPLGVY
jgi:hypothetical protein